MERNNIPKTIFKSAYQKKNANKFVDKKKTAKKKNEIYEEDDSTDCDCGDTMSQISLSQGEFECELM